MKQKITIMLMVLIASAGFIHAQVLEDFEGTPDVGAWGGYEASVIDNPVTTGNPSSKVDKIKKNWGHWDGSWVNFSTMQDYTAGKGLEIKVLSVRAGTSVMAKVENGASGNQEVAAQTTKAGEWEILKYDFSGIGANYQNLVLFINGGTEMDLPDSILVDDITMVTFAQSPKATLDSIKIDGFHVNGMHQTIFSYDVELPEGTSTVPVVAAWPAHAGATAVVNDAAALPGTTTVVVTAEDGVSSITYSVNFTVATGPQEPQTAAPTPPARTAPEVISIFSDAYTNLAGTDFNPWWWQSTVQTFDTIDGDAFMKYATFNYQGTQFSGAQNASDMEFLHVDMWTPNASTVNVFCVSTTSGEKSVGLPVTTGEWVSYDIPMTDFTSQGLTINDLHQFKFDGGDGTVTIFLDNLYFYRVIPAGTDASLSDLQVDGATINTFVPTNIDYFYGLVSGTTTVPTVTYTTTDPAATAVLTNAASIPGTTTVEVTAADGIVKETYSIEFAITKPAAGAPTPPAREPARVISVFSDAYTNLDGSDFNPNWGQATKVDQYEISAGDTVMVYDKLNWQGINLPAPQDMSTMDYVHIDMWTNDADAVITFFIIKEGTSEYGYVLPITLGEWVSYDIPISVYSENGVDVTGINQIKTTDEAGASNANITIDNIYFYSTVKSEDATLSDLTVSVGTLTPVFDAETPSYSVELPSGTTTVPTVTATPTDDKATVVISDATSLPGTTFITVTAEDPAFTKNYSIDFTVAVSVSSKEAVNFNAYVYDGMLNVSCDETLVNGNLEVFDITGKRLFQTSISSNREQYAIDTNGILIVKVTDSENQQVITRKVVSR